jgi:hypothetical protein
LRALEKPKKAVNQPVQDPDIIETVYEKQAVTHNCTAMKACNYMQGRCVSPERKDQLKGLL